MNIAEAAELTHLASPSAAWRTSDVGDSRSSALSRTGMASVTMRVPRFGEPKGDTKDDAFNHLAEGFYSPSPWLHSLGGHLPTVFLAAATSHRAARREVKAFIVRGIDSLQVNQGVILLTRVHKPTTLYIPLIGSAPL